jgi:putative ABC transport system permease protein
VVVSIALGVATLVVTQSFHASMDAATHFAATPLAGTAGLIVSNAQAGVPRDLAGPLAAVPGVRSVRPFLMERVAIADLDQRPTMLVGVDFRAEFGPGNPWGVNPAEWELLVAATNVAQPRKLVFVGSDLAVELAALPQERRQHIEVLVAGRRQTLPTDWLPLVGLRGPAAALSRGLIVMDLAEAAAFVGRPDLVTRFDVALEPGADRETVRRQVVELLAGRAGVWTAETHGQGYEEAISGLKIGFSLCGVGALVVGLFLVFNTLSVSVAERRHEIGVLRSLGATREQIAALFVGEAALLGALGSGVGLPLGLTLARFAAGPFNRTLGDLLVSPVEVPAPSPWTLLLIATAGIVTSVLAALIPAAHAASEAPADAVRRVPPASGWKRRFANLVSVALLVGAGVGCLALRLPWLPARSTSYGGIVLLLLGLLLSTPLQAALAARLVRPLAQRWLGLAERLAADNLARSPGRTGLVIAALAAGVALIVQTAGVIRSNEEPVLEWLEQTIAADLYITCGGPVTASGQNLPLDSELATRLATDFPEQIEAALPIRFQHMNHDQTIVLLVALDARAFYEVDSARTAPVPGLELYPRLADEPGAVLISNNFAAKHRVQVHDRLTMPGPGGPVALHVAGIVDDYSWNQGTLLIDRQQYRALFGDSLADVLDVYLRPGTDAETFRRTLQEWGKDRALFVLARGELLAHVGRLIRQVYSVALLQELVVGAVAVLGVVAALLISILQRRRELGLLRALGATQAQVVRSVVAEAALMGLVGTLIGIVVGLPLEWYIVRVLIFEESGFLFPVRVPWPAVALVGSVALLAATLAGLGPALHAAREPIPDAITYE